MDKNFYTKFILLACLLTVHGLTARPAGKIRVTNPGGRVEREYFIHVPSSYDGSSPVPAGLYAARNQWKWRNLL